MIDEIGLRAAREHAERIDWLDECAPANERADGERQLREIIAAYLGARPTTDGIPVRICVAVGEGDHVTWAGSDVADADDEEGVGFLKRHTAHQQRNPHSAQFHFVEVDLPHYAPVVIATVKGRVRP